MAEIDFLTSLPISKRKLNERRLDKDKNVIRIAREFGESYFDGDRKYGYGGYRYDGRWRSVARSLIDHYSLVPGMRVLDVGCAKGFLIKDLIIECPGLEVFGVDISKYALENCEKEVIGRLHLGDAKYLPFPDDSFDLVLSINTIHNFERNEVIQALREMMRVGKKHFYTVVDSFHTTKEKETFENWVLTAKFYDYPSGWLKVFEEAGYQGDFSWTIIN
jgi:ubiquinone/menaquinone biosynthesis C-methylase UbiE